MDSAPIDIDPVTHAKGLLHGTIVSRVRDSQLALQDEMRCRVGMDVRAVVSMP